MKEVKLTNGSAIIKDFCSHGAKKKIHEALFGGVSLKQEGGKINADGLSHNSMEKANELALELLVIEITIDGVRTESPKTSYFDEMRTEDYDTLVNEVNKLVNPVIPNE